MTVPHRIRIIDAQMGIGVEAERARRAGALRGLRDAESRRAFAGELRSPWPELGPDADASEQIAATIHDMDRHGIERAMVTLDDDRPLALEAISTRPDRFFASYECNPHAGVDEVRKIERFQSSHGIRAVLARPSNLHPQVPVDDRRFYPILAKCVELGLPFCPELGVPAERVPLAPQKVERIDSVAADFPELQIILRGGCEPWARLAVLLMRKRPNVSFMTWGAPASWSPEVLAFANGGGAGRILYAGDAPLNLPLEQSFKQLAEVALAGSVWPQILRENALRLFKL